MAPAPLPPISTSKPKGRKDIPEHGCNAPTINKTRDNADNNEIDANNEN